MYYSAIELYDLNMENMCLGTDLKEEIRHQFPICCTFLNGTQFVEPLLIVAVLKCSFDLLGSHFPDKSIQILQPAAFEMDV